MTTEKEYGLKRLHQDLLELMCFIHEFCETRNIKYSLTGGSLLGAVRHSGFIPWDDDFDIMFDRVNYEKFISAMKSAEDVDYVLERDQWVYRVRKHHKKDGYIPSIDLFVLDRIPKNRITYRLQILILKLLQGMLRENASPRKYSPFYSACIYLTKLMGTFFDKNKLFRKYDRLSQAGNKNGLDRLGIFDDKFKLIGYQYSGEIMNGYELHKFEDREFSIISHYEEYLVKQYGDYMELPPEAERVPMHSI